MDRAWMPRALGVVVAAVLVAGMSTSIAASAAVTAKPKPSRVTIALKQNKTSVTASGRAFRNGRSAANVVVTLSAGLMASSLTSRGTDVTGPDGRYAITVQKKGLAADPSDVSGSTYTSARRRASRRARPGA